MEELLTSKGTVASNLLMFRSTSEKLISILFIAFIQTSLAEEIFFRGFIGKRFIEKMGFNTGNIAQSLLFGLVHALLFLPVTQNALVLILVMISTSISGFILGIIKEKIGNGSLIPSWIAHGIGNVMDWMIIVFYL
jgi:uncharacterized protein